MRLPLPVHGLVYTCLSNTEHIISVLNPTFFYVAFGFTLSFTVSSVCQSDITADD